LYKKIYIFAFVLNQNILEMLFNRNLEKYILDWKEKTKRKPLIIRGARQVGKTTLVEKIGQNYDIFISLNLEKANHRAYFGSTDEVKRIFDGILLDKNIALLPNQKCLLFIDEIQQSPHVIKLLRYFYEELPEIHVIAAGSLLEFALNEIDSFPVGRVEQVVLHPMNFEEFLFATGKTSLYERLSTCDFSDTTYPVFYKEFCNYMVIGGMPEAISQYISDGFSFKNLNSIFENIWVSYLDDTLKYGKNELSKKILRYILETSPFTLDRFSFASIGQTAYQGREIAEGFRQLERARILSLIYPTTSLEIPIIPDFKKRPRIQLLDTGLLLFINKKSVEFLLNNAINDQFRGQIFNHIALQENIATSHSLLDKTLFWVRESTDANAEIDLVIDWQGLVIPIEIKAGSTGKLRSLHEYMDRCPHNLAVRLLANNFSVETIKTPKGKSFQLVNLPIFAAAKIRDVLNGLNLNTIFPLM
jgi:uncharacterized protein